MSFKELEFKYKTELGSVLPINYKISLKKYLNLLVSSLQNNEITNSKFDSCCFNIVLTSPGELNDPIVDEIVGLCSDLDIPDGVDWWKSRDRKELRIALIDLVSKL